MSFDKVNVAKYSQLSVISSIKPEQMIFLWEMCNLLQPEKKKKISTEGEEAKRKLGSFCVLKAQTVFTNERKETGF